MRNGVLMIACVLVTGAGVAWAQETPGPVPLPCTFTAGITSDGTDLWCVDRKGRVIHRVDTATGESLETIAIDAVHAAGLEWWDGRLYLVEGRERVLCRINPQDGSVELTVPLGGRGPTGIVIHEGRAWTADWDSPTIEVRDLAANGKLLKEIPAPHNPLWGGAYHDGVLWFLAPDHRLAYAMDAETGEVLGALPTPMDKPTYVVALDGQLAMGSWQTNTLVRVPIDMELARASLPERPPMAGEPQAPHTPVSTSNSIPMLIAAGIALAVIVAAVIAWRRRVAAAGDYTRRPEVVYTFLAIDVRDSTELKARREPVAVRRTFDAYHAWIKRMVEQHGGEVYSRSGDGALCRFARASDALTAARALRADLDAFNTEHNRLGKALRIGMGLHTGPLLESPDDDRGQVASESLDFAMKLQAQADAGEILLSGETLSRLPSHEGIEEAGQLFSQTSVYRVA